MKVIRYSEELQDNWNSFLEKSKNSTFLFHRNFMDYHKDRFSDYSLMIYDDKNDLVACFPAMQSSATVITSHAGLTYGGLVLKREEKLNNTIEVFKAILKFLYDNGFEKIILKDFPKFYNNSPSEEIEYALFLSNAKIIRRDTAIVIDNLKPIKYQSRRERSVKKGIKIGVTIDELEDFTTFWNSILTPNLNERFGVNPVHSLEEILLLKNFFPEEIKLYTSFINGKMMAGTVLFITPDVVHAQYISGIEEGRNNGALDFLFDFVIKKYATVKYFDFGICNENAGRDLNFGLLDWKEGFGGRTFCHNFYEIETVNH
ncbi:MAG: hypothetical protein RJA25_979 [Bacteroidota bacterium]|jgi:hypothetical protein